MSKAKKPRARVKFTKEQDNHLRNAVAANGPREWKKVSEIVFGSPDYDVQCFHRWQKVLNPKVTKGPWTKEEDDQVKKLVDRFGAKKWSLIASHLPGRIGKQCRERWHNHLNPTIKKGPFTEAEDRVILDLHRKLGNKWAEIAKHLPGRTDNAIKNRWNSSMKKRYEHDYEQGVTREISQQRRSKKRKSNRRAAVPAGPPADAPVSRVPSHVVMTDDTVADHPSLPVLPGQRMASDAMSPSPPPTEAQGPLVPLSSQTAPGIVGVLDGHQIYTNVQQPARLRRRRTPTASKDDLQPIRREDAVPADSSMESLIPSALNHRAREYIYGQQIRDKNKTTNEISLNLAPYDPAHMQTLAAMAAAAAASSSAPVASSSSAAPSTPVRPIPVRVPARSPMFGTPSRICGALANSSMAGTLMASPMVGLTVPFSPGFRDCFSPVRTVRTPPGILRRTSTPSRTFESLDTPRSIPFNKRDSVGSAISSHSAIAMSNPFRSPDLSIKRQPGDRAGGSHVPYVSPSTLKKERSNAPPRTPLGANPAFESSDRLLSPIVRTPQGKQSKENNVMGAQAFYRSLLSPGTPKGQVVNSLENSPPSTQLLSQASSVPGSFASPAAGRTRRRSAVRRLSHELHT